MRKFLISAIAALATVGALTSGVLNTDDAFAAKVKAPFLSFKAQKHNFKSRLAAPIPDGSAANVALSEPTHQFNLVASYGKFVLNRRNPTQSRTTNLLVTITGATPAQLTEGSVYPVTVTGVGFVYGGGTTAGATLVSTVGYGGTVDVTFTGMANGRLNGTFVGSAETGNEDPDVPASITISKGKFSAKILVAGKN